MRPISLALLVALSAGAVHAGGDGYLASTTEAARELARQLEFLQRSFANIPGPPEGRGLYQQAEKIQYDLIYLRQQIKRQVSRESLYIAFDKVDLKLNALLGDLQAFENWVPSVRMTARAVRSAQHDLQFALSGGDGTPARQSQVIYRQTLVLKNRVEELEGMVRFVFDEQDALKPWLADFASLKRSIAELQKAQQAKAPPADVKNQLAQTDGVWEKLVGKFKELPEGQHLLLRLDFGRADQVFARLAALMGIDKRRPTLKAEFN